MRSKSDNTDLSPVKTKIKKKSSSILVKSTKIVMPGDLDFHVKSRNYVDSLFDVGTAPMPWETLPDNYDPLDVMHEDSQFDLSKLMDKAIDKVTGLPRDIRLPEGDFPEAKNYFDYCENFTGTDTKFPFARQMWAGIHLLAEYCPICSHPKWQDALNVGVGADPKNIPNNVQLLHYGKCPKCKITKRELFAQKKLNLYVEGAWLWGQRAGKCVKEDTLILTENGLVEIKRLGPDAPYGFSKYKGPRLVMEDGTLVKPSHFYVERKTRTKIVTASNGLEITGTYDHPLLTIDGYKTLGKGLALGDVLPITIGQNIWPSAKLDLTPVIDKTNAVLSARKDKHGQTHHFSEGVLPKIHLDEDLAFVLGVYIAEGYSYDGKSFSISNTDQKLLDKCQQILENVFPELGWVCRTTTGLTIHRLKAVTFLNFVLGDQVKNRSAAKRVPESILQSPKSVVVSFLKGLFEGDGGLERATVSYCSLSKQLVHQVGALCCNLGIPVVIKSAFKTATNGSADQVPALAWVLRLRGRLPITVFHAEIGFFSDRKQKALDKVVHWYTTFNRPNPSWSEKLPKVIQDRWQTIISDIAHDLKAHTIVVNGVQTIRSPGLRSVFPGLKPRRVRIGLTKSMLEKQANQALLSADKLSKTTIKSITELRDYATNPNVYFVTVDTILEGAQQQTYDFTVPKYHRFIGNGIINHNSTVTGSLTNYITHKYLKFPKMSSICEGIQASTPLTATFVGLRFADAMATLWEPITKGIADSPWFCLAEGTEISLADGTTKPIETMTVGDVVTTLEGEHPVANVFDNGIQECFDIDLENGNTLTGTDKHQVRCLGDDGVSLVWKNIKDLTEDDYCVTATCNSKVKAKTAVGLKHVYDFEVKDVHNYYANGINVHNCEYHAMLDDYGKRLGIEFYRFKDQYLRYGHKNLELYPAGPSKRALRGRTRFLSGLDELGWFPVGTENKDLERADADQVHIALDRSLLTMRREVRELYKKGFSNFIPGIAINISSPSDETDKMCRLVNENRTSTSTLAMQMATWNISPLFSKDNEEIAEAFRKNPVDAERDYGAVPPMNSKSFIDMTIAARGFTGHNRASVVAEEKTINDTRKRAGRIVTSTPMNPMPASVMSIDAGHTNNSFAITIQTVQQTKVMDIEQLKIIVPVAIEIQARMNVYLHYSQIYKEIMKPLIRDFNVRYLFADRWNSIALLDTAEEDFKSVGLIAKQHSVKYPDFQLTRSYLEEGKLILPKIEMPLDQIRNIDSYPSYFEGKPAAHLLFQFGTVRDMGNTVIKGGVYTDDIFRALVLGCGRIMNDKILPEILRMSTTSTGRNIGAVAMGRSVGMNSMAMGMALRHRGLNTPTGSGSSVALVSGNTAMNPSGGSTFYTSQVARANRNG